MLGLLSVFAGLLAAWAGVRGVVVAIGTLCLIAGALFGQTWLLVFGGVFLVEELYETGVVVLVLRAADPQ